MTLTTWLPLLTVLVALVGAVLTALRFNREESKVIVSTQSTVLADMKSLNEELDKAITRLRMEKTDLIARNVNLESTVRHYEEKIRRLELEIKLLDARKGPDGYPA